MDGSRDRRTAGGCVIDVTTGDVVAEGLSMPHSPRWYRERLWVLNSGKGELGRVDLAAGRFEPIAFCPGYLRGLAFAGDHAIVSLSQPRHDKTFGGLALDGELARRNADAQCGLQIIDLKTGTSRSGSRSKAWSAKSTTSSPCRVPSGRWRWDSRPMRFNDC